MGLLSQTICLALYFMLLFTAYLSFQNIITQLYQQLDQPYLGKLSLFSIYASFMISGLVAPFIGRKLNYKTMLIISSICYTLNFSSGLILELFDFNTWVVVAIEVLAVVGGFSAGMLWVTQAAYIHFICERNGMQAKKGYYFGVFYGVYGISNITSGLITTFMLGLFDKTIYFWILFGIGVLSIFFCLFFIEDVQKKYAQKDNEDMSLIRSSMTTEKPKENLLQSILKVFKFYPKMLPLLSSIGLVGIAIAFYASSLHHILALALPSDSSAQYTNLRTGIMFLILGVGEIVGGYAAGHLSDKLSVQKVGALALSFYFMSCILSMVAVSYHETVVPVMAAAFFWGLQQAYIQNWITVVCSRTYKGALEAFVINKQFHSFTLCIYEGILIFVHPPMEILLPVLLFLGLPCLLSLPYIEEDQMKDRTFRTNIQSVSSDGTLRESLT